MNWWKSAEEIAKEVKKHADNGVGIGAAGGYIAGAGTAATGRAAKAAAKSVATGAKKVKGIPAVKKENKEIDARNDDRRWHKGSQMPKDSFDPEIFEKKKGFWK